MSGVTLDSAFEVLEQCVAEGLVPGAAAAAGTAGETLRRAQYGFAELTPERRPMAADALFDCASLTKIVVTATLLLRYLERGRIYLEQRVSSILPACGAAGKEDVTVRHLMTHTSGLPAWANLYARSAAPQH